MISLVLACFMMGALGYCNMYMSIAYLLWKIFWIIDLHLYFSNIDKYVSKKRLSWYKRIAYGFFPLVFLIVYTAVQGFRMLYGSDLDVQFVDYSNGTYCVMGSHWAKFGLVVFLNSCFLIIGGVIYVKIYKAGYHRKKTFRMLVCVVRERLVFAGVFSGF